MHWQVLGTWALHDEYFHGMAGELFLLASRRVRTSYRALVVTKNLSLELSQSRFKWAFRYLLMLQTQCVNFLYKIELK